MIGYGANPDECCDIVRELGMPVISGNYDLAVTDLETDLNWFNLSPPRPWCGPAST